ncbi:MAG: hypothetical protein WBB28_09355 [Crinalium sp.]
MKKITSLVLATVFGSAISIPVLARPAIISGKQYVVLNQGATPIPDNLIWYFPCKPVNNNCQQVKSELSKSFLEATQKVYKAEVDRRRNYISCVSQGNTSCDSPLLEGMKNLVDSIGYAAWLTSEKSANQALNKLRSGRSIRTDFDGNFSLNCPTKECLVYSYGEVGRTSSFWIEVITAGIKTDLSGSKAFTVDKPDTWKD